jgi:hypothetical protein
MGDRIAGLLMIGFGGVFLFGSLWTMIHDPAPELGNRLMRIVACAVGAPLFVVGLWRLFKRKP